MLKKDITYTDFDGVEKTTTHYFNLSKSEISRMELTMPGGLVGSIEKVTKENDGAQIMSLFEKLVLASYGEKSADGLRFMKSDEIARNFSWTMAYDALFMELVTNPDAGAAFLNGIIPQEFQTKQS